MAAQTELPRPGVEVIQVFRTVSPTVTTPTLVPCVVGPCKQVVEATVQSAAGGSSLNADALIQTPASFLATDGAGDPPSYSLSKGVLVFGVNRHAEVVVSFAAGTYKPTDVVKKVNDALTAAGEVEAYARVVEVDGVRTSWRLRTVGSDEFQVLDIDPAGSTQAVLTGTVDLTSLVYGVSGDLDGLTLGLSIDGGAEVVTTFTAPANEAAALAAINTALGATATASQASGTNYLEVTSASTGKLSQVQVTSGTALTVLGLTLNDSVVGEGSTPSVLSTFGLNTKDVFFGANNYAGYELVVPPSSFPDPRDNYEELSIENATIRTFLSVSGGSSALEALRTSSLLRKGGSVTVIDDGNGDNLSPFLDAAGEDFTSLSTVPTAATVTGADAPTFASLSGKTLTLSDGRTPRQVTFGTCAAIADVVDQINAVWNTGDGLLADASAGKLRLTSTKKREDGTTLAKGEDSQLVILGGSAITPTNYLDPGNIVLSRLLVRAANPVGTNATFQQVAVGVERQLRRNLVVSADGIGNFGRHIAVLLGVSRRG